MTGITTKLLLPESTDAAQQIWQLREAVLRRPLGLSLRDEDLSGELEEQTLYAADTAGQILGCLMLRRLDEMRMKLRQMAVSPEVQRLGIGRLLVGKAEEVARQQGCQRMELHARAHAVGFYEKLGYQVEGASFQEVGIPHRRMCKFIGCAAPPEK